MKSRVKLSNKVLSVVMSLVMLMTVFSVAFPGFAIIAKAAWDGSTRTTPSLVEGYYIIDTPEKMAWFSYEVTTNNQRSINGKLTADIDLGNKSWTPIGNNNRRYEGHFDGQGYTVSNLNITLNANDRGFFGKATASSVIENINFINASLSNGSYSGIVVGVITGATVKNCHVTGININASSSRIGGIVGLIESGGKVIDCSVTGTAGANTISASQYIGGISGYSSGNGDLISGCEVSNINLNATDVNSNIAGIIGYIDNSMNIYDCLVKGSSITGARYMGGIAFVIRNNSTVERTGVVDTSITSTYSNSGADAEVGGLVGVVVNGMSRIQYSYTNNVSITAAARMVGGFIGKSVNSRHIISECYSNITSFTNTVTSNNVGIFAGLADYGVYTNCFYTSLGGHNVVATINSNATVMLTEVSPSDVIDGSLLNYMNAVTDVWKTADAGYPEIDQEKTQEPELVGGFYEIQNPYQLNWFADFVNNGNTSVNAKLMSDIDLSTKEFTGIGNSSNRYSGTFLGNDHKISNLNNTTVRADNAGLFGYTNNASISGIKLEDVTIVSSNGYVGSFIGRMSGGSLTDSSVSGVSISGTNCIGGLVGQMENTATIENCSIIGTNDKKSILGNQNIAGVAGYITSGTHTVKFVTVSNIDFTGTSTEASLGGIAGFVNSRLMASDTIVKDCTLTGNRRVGGFSGNLNAGSMIDACGVVNSTINSTNSSTSTTVQIGGFVGLVGWSTANTVQYSYVTGVTINAIGREVGGFIGNSNNANHIYKENYSNAVLTNEASTYMGSFVGNRSSGTVQDCFSVPSGNLPLTGSSSVLVSGNTSGITAITAEDVSDGTLTNTLNSITSIWQQANDDFVTGWAEVGDRTPPSLVEGYYEIYSGYQLEWFMNHVNLGNVSSNARLMADVNLNSKEFTSIGSNDRRYAGTFDGNNFSIINLKITSTGNDQGLFGSTAPSVLIKDLTLKNVDINSTSSYVGGFAGVLRGNIINCHIEGIKLQGSSYVGGFAGFTQNNASIENSSVIGSEFANTIRATSEYSGGLIGNINTSTSTITDCIVEDLELSANRRSGAIMGDTDGGVVHIANTNVSDFTITVSQYAGGITFGLRNGSTLTNVTAKDFAIIATSTSNDEIGGLVGCTSGGKITINNSMVDNATITGQGTRVGGLIGYVNNQIEVSDTMVKNSDITANREVGGFSYNLANGSIIQKCAVLDSTVTSTNTSTTTEVNTGGFIGVVGWSSANRIQFSYVQNVSVNANGRMVGGFLGKIDTANHLVSENYANAVSVNSNASYVGSFIGYRTSGSFANCYAVIVNDKPLVGNTTIGGISEVSLLEVNDGTLVEMLNDAMDVWRQADENFVNGYPEIGEAEPPQLVDGYYQINSSFHLEWFKNFVNNENTSANAKLTKNINLRNREWEPIGNNSRQYAGHFDGQGYTVSNVYVNSTAVDRGFFGKANASALIENLNINNITIENDRDYSGGLIGVINNSTIQNCHVTSLSISTNRAYVGGIVGQIENSGKIINCSVNGTENANTISGSQYLGGLVGRTTGSGAVITNCVANGVNLIASNSSSNVGGAIGHSAGKIVLTDTYVNDCTIEGGRYIGGLAFVVRDGTIVERCGVDNLTIISSYVSTSSDAEIGGFIGIVYNSAVNRIQYSYANNISITANARAVGGFIGKSESGNHIITECYLNASNVTGAPTRVGAFIGYAGSGSYTNCFYTPVTGLDFSGETASGASVVPVSINSTDVTDGTLLSQLNLCTDLWVEASNGIPMADITKFEPPTLNEGYYELYNTYHFEWFALAVNNGSTSLNARLMTDIDLGEKNFTPIGTSSNRYSGTFEGNGYKLTNLKIKAAVTENAGMFGYTSGANISNLLIENVYISSNSAYVGSVVGRMNSGSLTDCIVTGLNIMGTHNVGGLVGRMENLVTINNCTVEGTSSSKNISGTQYLGGLVGYTTTNGSSIINCFVNNVNVTGTQVDSVVGGLLGYMAGRTTIAGSIVEDCILKGNRSIGGLVYNLLNGSIIEGCGVVNTSINSTNTSATALERVGGFIGISGWDSSNTIQYSYATGITIDAVGREVGGFVGNSNNANHSIVECYANATFVNTSALYVGTFIGNRSSGFFQDCFGAEYENVPLAGSSTTHTAGNTNGMIETSDAAVKDGSLTSTLNNITAVWKQANDDFENGWPEVGELVLPELIDGFYEIHTGYQLEWFMKHVNAGNPTASAKLMADINLNNKAFTAIGSNSNRYAGTFDGSNYSILNLKVTATGNDQGLFGSTTPTAVIKNLTLNNVNITSTASFVGGVVGLLRGNIINCHIEGANIQGASYVGGLVGQSENNASIENCSVTGTPTSNTIRATSAYSGGLVGNVKTSSSTITDSIVRDINFFANSRSGAIMGDTDGGVVNVSNTHALDCTIAVSQYAGGITFGLRNGSTLINVTATNMTITATSTSNDEIGGLVGCTSGNKTFISDATVDNVSITGAGTRAGGLVGFVNSQIEITNSLVKNTNITIDSEAGGLTYNLMSGSIVNNCAVEDSSIISTKASATSDSNIGGFIGIVGWGSSNAISYSYVSNIDVSANGRNVGGFIGKMDNANHSVSNCFTYDTSVNSEATYTGSFIGYRTSGTYENCFAVEPSRIILVGSNTLDIEGNTAGISSVEIFNDDISDLPTDDLILFYVQGANFLLALEDENSQILIETVFAQYYDDLTDFLEKLEVELSIRLNADLDALIEIYDEYDMVCLFNYSEIAVALDAIYTAIYDNIELSQEILDKYNTYLAIYVAYNEYVAHNGYTSHYEYTVDYPTRIVRADDKARYVSPEDDYSVTRELMSNVIEKIDNALLSEDLASLAGLDAPLRDTIEELLSENLYKDEFINKIIEEIYPMIVEELETAIEENAEIDLGVTTITFRGKAKDIINELVSDFNLSLYPRDLANKLDAAKYSEVISVLNAAGQNWGAINFEDPEADNYLNWGVVDKDSFIDALGNSLRGIFTVVRPMLTSNSFNEKHGADVIANIDVDVRIIINAMNVYNNALVPLLEMFNVTGFIPSEQFDSLTSVDDMIDNIAYPLFNWIENELANAPLNELIGILPNLAYSLEFNLLENLLKTIKASVSYDIDGVFDYWLGDIDFGITDGSIDVDVYEMLSEEEGDILYDADLSSISGILQTIIKNVIETDIAIPPLNNKVIASLGSVVTLDSATTAGTRYYIQPNVEDTLYTLLHYIFTLVGDEELIKEIMAAIDEVPVEEVDIDGTVLDLIRGLGESPEDAIAAIVELFNPSEYPMREISYVTEPPIPLVTAQYSSYWTRQNANYVTENLDDFINNVLKILGLDTLDVLLSDLVGGELYTNENINRIVSMFKDLFEDSSNAELIVTLLNLDISVWQEIEQGHDWGFVDGDKDAFLDALTQALSPLNDLLALFLAGRDFSVLDEQITAKGYQGYANGIAPMLEALGCNFDDIVSGEQYLADIAVDESAMIKNIIVPIFNLLDRVYADPVNTIFSILPNIIYFIQVGAFDTAIANILQPAFVLMDTIRPIYSLDFNLEFDLDSLFNSLIESISDEDFKLPEFDGGILGLLIGALEPVTSTSGETIYVIKSVNEDILTIILRYIVETIFYENNEEYIVEQIIGTAEMDSIEANTLKSLFSALEQYISEPNGEDKVLWVFFYLIYGGNTAALQALDFLNEFNESWKNALEMLTNSESEIIRSFAETFKDILDKNFSGIIDSDGLASGGFISFFQRIIDFFNRMFDFFKNLF